MFSNGSNMYIYIILIVLALGFAVFYIASKIKQKKTQWTHKLIVRRELPGGRLTNPITFNMRRFPLIKGTEVFELEKPVLGSYLFPELDSYSNVNEYSIVIDNSNRIFTNKGEYFNPDKNSVNVSARFSEISLEWGELKSKYQNINKVKKRLDAAEIIKYSLIALGIIALMIVSIVAVNKWGESRQAMADSNQAQADAMDTLKSVSETNLAVMNTLKLMLPDIKELKGTQNIQNLINEEAEEDEDI